MGKIIYWSKEVADDEKYDRVRRYAEDMDYSASATMRNNLNHPQP